MDRVNPKASPSPHPPPAPLEKTDAMPLSSRASPPGVTAIHDPKRFDPNFTQY